MWLETGARVYTSRESQGNVEAGGRGGRKEGYPRGVPRSSKARCRRGQILWLNAHIWQMPPPNRGRLVHRTLPARTSRVDMRRHRRARYQNMHGHQRLPIHWPIPPRGCYTIAESSACGPARFWTIEGPSLPRPPGAAEAKALLIPGGHCYRCW